MPKIKESIVRLCSTQKEAMPLIAKAATIHPYTAVINFLVMLLFACLNAASLKKLLLIYKKYKQFFILSSVHEVQTKASSRENNTSETGRPA